MRITSLLVGLTGVSFAGAGLYLSEGEVAEDVGEDGTRTEVDAGLLDEGFLPVFLLEGALAGDTDLESAKVAQADDFSVLEGVGNHIFKGHQHCKDITLVHRTGLLDAFGHFAEVDVAVGLDMAVILRLGFTVARVDTRGYGIGYISCHVFEF